MCGNAGPIKFHELEFVHQVSNSVRQFFIRRGSVTELNYVTASARNPTLASVLRLYIFGGGPEHYIAEPIPSYPPCRV